MLISYLSTIGLRFFASFSKAPLTTIFVLLMMTKSTHLPAQKFLLHKEALVSKVISIPTLSMVELDKMGKVSFEGTSRGPTWDSLPILK